MRKGLLFSAILPLIILFFVGTSYSWLGRMGGMGGPFGLVADESDFLVHPAKIVQGQGTKFYGHYRFIYTGVTDWGWKKYSYNVLAGLRGRRGDTSGQELDHNAMLGAAYPLGPGRMGLFFAYHAERDYYDGLLRYSSGVVEGVELMNNLDDFALRLLYGLPVGGFNLGGEVQFAYRQEEEKEYYYYFSPVVQLHINETLNFITPHTSKYWEALFKGSMEGEVGPLDVELTVRGGLVFGGNNHWRCELQDSIGAVYYSYDLHGDVQGWRIGGDLWARYPLTEDLILPFLMRVDYQEKTRDGAGPIVAIPPGGNYDYKHQERNFHLEAGGGLDKELATGMRIAVGIYYNYLQGSEGVLLYHDDPVFPSWYVDDNTLSDLTEHQLLLRFTGELELSPVVTLRIGFTPFYGWVHENISFTYFDSAGNVRVDHVSNHGSHWGIGVSLGGSVQVGSFTLEPFINGGWQQIDLDGDGESVFNGALDDLRGYESIRSEWSIGGGMSVLFDVP